ncbi:protein-methionine-sulfoxide reductase heme-binding subunit MsrQ [Chiayiivirga flava]|nr:protein-methionine-sulfoxide reductase heme-binding subunit MsrQ [Chiayiivirga flava]
MTKLQMIAVKTVLHVLALLPFAWLVADIYLDRLGADPIAELTHATGLWALRFLLLALTVTPLRRVTGWNVLARFRRLIGLYAFFYASVHLSIYLVLDLGGYWSQILEDIVKRPYITVGFAAWCGLLALALTSTRGMMRRLGRRWTQLHRIVYGIGVLAVLHFWWLVKSDVREPAVYAALLALLLVLRLPPVARRIQRRPRAPAPVQRGA